MQRLLEKGYNPAHIELEPRWNLGRDAKGGRADILVRDNEGNPYLLIECKTTDSKNSEFRKEWARMQNDGGQLFSYFQQERGVKFLCLYTSDFVNNALKYENYIINMQDNESYLKEHKKQGYKDANTTKELFSVWANTYANDFREQGIFEPQIQSYNISVIKPNLENLSHIDSHSMQKKRHEWATILRANAVGDRGLALNKFMNLLLCKITDEIENKDDLAFFWKGFSGDTPFELVDRLQKLYQIGMQKFLKQNITYHSKDSIDKAFSKHFRDTTVREKIQNIFNELKYFSNGDFNFIEVYNKEQFDKNFNILLPVVISLQSIKFTDTKDSNILGDYFETYIHDMPQQEGQYFTPVPLVNFIINSLPTFHQTQVLDFACGAGHFLTQYAEFHKGKDITFFGIDKDSRLAKIAKIASFMHGIDSHIEANDSLKLGVIKNQSCNVLISNPPYSVDGFLGNLTQSDREQYELFSENIKTKIETNDKIQCFLIEKASKALKSGGLLSLVLPSSLLNKSTEIDSKTIEILLRDFYIISICAFGDSTFFKTGTQPIILYAIRKPQRQSTATTKDDIYEDFIKHILEGKIDKLPKIYDNFLALLEQYALFRGIDKDELKALFALDLAQDSTLYQNESFAEYKEEYQKILAKQKVDYDKKSAKYKDNNPFTPTQSQAEFVREKECEKFLYFCYCIDSTPLIIKAPSDKKEQKKFLGYEWSTTKGQEGIRYLNATSIAGIQTPLYNPKNQFDANKLNYYILQNFYTHSPSLAEGVRGWVENSQIPKELTKYTFNARLVDMIDFSRADFSKAINLNLSNASSQSANLFANSKFELVRLGEAIVENPKSQIKVAQAKENTTGKYPFYTSGLNIYRYDTALISGENIYLSTGGNAIVQFYDGECAYSTDTYAIKSKVDDILTKFLYLLLESITPLINEFYFKGMGLKHLQKTELKNMQIPKPPLEIQKQIIAECEKVESQSQNINDLIALYKDLIRAILGKCGISNIDAPLPSLRESRSDSWQSTDTITALLDLINKGESNLDFDKEPTPKSPPQGRGFDSSESIAQEEGFNFEAFCHSEGVRSTTEESKTNFLDTSAFAKPQYDKTSISSTITSDDSIDSSSLVRGDSESSPFLAEDNFTSSPSLAEGALAWVKNLTTLLKSLPTPPKNGWDTIALSNSDIFELQIGERVLDNELHEQGKIPVYSANVTKPFGFIEKELLEKLENYDKDSVLWGIDGDFMVSFIPKNTPFYPTDHCGVLRVKDNSVNVRIAGFGLENEGAKFGFSRNLRASISRIKSLKIPLPPLSEQNKIIAPIEWIESKITALDSALSALESTKSKILQKYL